MKKYYPILLSKPGELTALSKLDPTIMDEISPILQILDGTIERVKTFSEIWGSRGNEVFLDFSLMKSFNSADISQLMSHLRAEGVNVIPVVHERNNKQYTPLVISLFGTGIIDAVCVRFSSTSGGFDNIDSKITSLFGIFGIQAHQVSVLLDFGLIEYSNYSMIASLASKVVHSIANKIIYKNVIVAAGSFPENLGSLSPAGRVYRLTRYEWDLWTALQFDTGVKGTITYSDYGTKHPYYSEANFQGSCSIKYTQEDEFVIYRGLKSGNHPDGNGQYLTFSRQLVSSSDYSGATFSWGDGRIDFYAQQIMTDPRKRTGNAGSWVEISQNHHITLLASLL
ncbi:MAG: hypothetical protein C0433_10310 [Cyclobacterium sp.]|nr:hypothetical protein [Cyclobacterium sp.]